MVWDTREDEHPCPRRSLAAGGWEWQNHKEKCVDGYYGDAPCETCHGTGYLPYRREGWYFDGRTIEALLGAYFDIDPAELEREKKAILDYLRDLGDQEAHE